MSCVSRPGTSHMCVVSFPVPCRVVCRLSPKNRDVIALSVLSLLFLSVSFLPRRKRKSKVVGGMLRIIWRWNVWVHHNYGMTGMTTAMTMTMTMTSPTVPRVRSIRPCQEFLTFRLACTDILVCFNSWSSHGGLVRPRSASVLPFARSKAWTADAFAET